jgi:ethanolamine permease
MSRIEEEKKKPGLTKVLGVWQIWALGVGLVISGEYFGWNYGWSVTGPLGFAIATLLVTLFYVAFIFSFTELTTSIPHAGGPFAYGYAAFGPWGGLLMGYATLVEFVFAPPAIAFAIGSYVHFLYPSIPVVTTAVSSYVIFTLINLIGIKESALFTLIVTVMAIVELLLFFGVVSPSFHMTQLTKDVGNVEWSGIFAALPFAIWFYLGIEGIAMASEEIKDPQKNIPRGYILAMITLVILVAGVMMMSSGSADWHRLSKIDYPLPETISIVLGKNNEWTKIFSGIGLLGLIASFHSLIIGYSRQIFALARSGFLPKKLSNVNTQFQTPHWAIISGGIIGIIAIYTGSTNQIIIVSAIGAITMYAFSMISLFKLKKNKKYTSTYSTPAYPWFPIIALIFSIVFLVAMIYYNTFLFGWFIGGLIFVGFLFKLFKKNETTNLDEFNQDEKTLDVI